MLVEAIKEQQKQIETLKDELNRKDNKAQLNENRVQSLEASVKTLNSQVQLLLELVGKNEGLKAGK
jgi:peptidoglycan hydrolase CwlO-like protein